jgi:hypothetical protein
MLTQREVHAYSKGRSCLLHQFKPILINVYLIFYRSIIGPFEFNASTTSKRGSEEKRKVATNRWQPSFIQTHSKKNHSFSSLWKGVGSR